MMRVPLRFALAAAVAAATLVAAFVTTGFVLLAMDTDGRARVGYLALACAAATFVLVGIGVLAGWTAIRRRWIRILRGRRRRDQTISTIVRKVEKLPTGQVVRDLDERVGELAAKVLELQNRVKGLPDTPRLHKIIEVSMSQTTSSVDGLRSSIGGVANDVTALGQDLQTARREIAAEARRGNQLVTAQSGRLYGQVDGLAALYAMLRPDGALPALFEEWAIGADLAAHLVRHVFRRRPSTIVELGSGSSTVILAMACERVGHGHVLAIEHDQKYATRTADMVASAGLSDWVTIAVAPLENQSIGDRTYPWYRLEDVDVPEQIGMLLVDGPPGSTGPEARFPAVPMLRDRLDENSVVFLDDARRDDEAGIVRRWCEEYGLALAAGIRFTTGTAELVTRPVEGDARLDQVPAAPSDANE